MPETKNAKIRYKAIDACLSNFHRKYFIEDIVQKCNEYLAELGEVKGKPISVKERQVYEDMKHIESEIGYGFTIVKHIEGKRRYYRYEYPEVSIIGKEPGVNARQRGILLSALKVLQQVNGLPHYDWLDDVIPMLSLQIDKRKMEKEIIEFEHNSRLKGKIHLKDLFNYISEEKVVQVYYHPFDEPQALVWIMHPYYLKQNNHRWFCLAYINQEKKIYTLALDRIISMRVIDYPYHHNTYIDTKNYFKSIIGVTRFEEAVITEIKFQIKPKRVQYIITKPIHISQTQLTQTKENEWTQFCITVFPNNELEAKILELGDDIEVLSPPHIRNQIAEKLQKASNIYIKANEVF